MNRREYLAALGSGIAVAVTGCSGSASPSTPESTPMEDLPCPPYGRASGAELDRVVCSHIGESAPVELLADPARAAVADGEVTERVELTLHNRSDDTLAFNPNSWEVYRDVGAGWTTLEREISGTGILTVEPDSTHAWSLTEAVGLIREDPQFRPGTYATVLGVNAEGTDEWTDLVAVVRLRAEGNGN